MVHRKPNEEKYADGCGIYIKLLFSLPFSRKPDCISSVRYPVRSLPFFAWVFNLGFHILAIFFVVKFHAQVHVQYLAAFGGGIGYRVVHEFVVFPALAKIHTNSRRCVKGSLKWLSKCYRRTRRALAILRVSMGRAFFIQWQTALNYITLAMTQTANLLVSTM